jgi:phytoene synthase
MALNEQQALMQAAVFELAANGEQSDLATDYAVCREIMLNASKNYTFASKVLPKDKLHHVEALYAVMRVGDDRVDVSHEGFSSPQAAIRDWHESYRRAFETGDSHYPVLRAYLHTAQKFDIPPGLLEPYFRAMQEDLTITRFATFDDLLHYMEGSAMTVGRVMAHILGTHTEQVSEVYPQADALSIAMQLSNFWRDVGQDWGIERVYIPQEDMARFGVSEDDLADQRITPAFIQLMEFEFERTEEYYRQARHGVYNLADGRWGVMSALEIYRAILFSVRRNGYNVFTVRAGTSTWQKIGLVSRAWWLTRRNQPLKAPQQENAPSNP